MADDIAAHLSSVTLSEEESVVIGADYDPKAHNDNEPHVNLMLIAKFFSTSSPDFPRMRTALKRLWNVKEGFTIREVGDKLYAIQFFKKRDLEKVMGGRPWNFDNCLLNLEFASTVLLPHELEFAHSPFWLRTLNVPMGHQTRLFAELLGDAFGQFIVWDNTEL